MIKLFATFEVIHATRGIVALTDAAGAFAGAYRVDARDPADLYELAYQCAAQAAAVKGARLERFTKEEG